jgi:exodeoxyribonuclease VII large subunit
LRQRLARAMRYRLLMGRQGLVELAQHGAFARMMDGINQRQQKLDDLHFRLERSMRQKLEQQRRRWEVASAAVRHYDARRVLNGIRKELEAQVTALSGVQRNMLLHHRARLDQLSAELSVLSPLSILERGYALVFDSSGNLVKDAEQIQGGEEISAKVARGEFRAIVKERF